MTDTPEPPETSTVEAQEARSSRGAARTMTANEPRPGASLAASMHDTKTWTSPSHEGEVIEHGRLAWTRIKIDHNWHDWVRIGKALVIGRAEAMRQAHAGEPKGKRYSAQFSAWLNAVGFGDMDHGDRARLFRCIDRLADVERWRARISAAKRRAFNHPSTVWRHFERAAKAPLPDRPKPASPIAQLTESVVRLQRENAALKANGGDLFSPKDKPFDIVRALVAVLGPTKASIIFDEGRRFLDESKGAAKERAGTARMPGKDA
jgi:hypothetical protein